MSSNSTIAISNNDVILEQYFGYLPNVPLAVTAVILYFAVSLPLFYQSYKNHNKLTYVLPITGLVESAGYIVRLYMIKNASLNVYVLMGLLIILAPNALAFANYKVLGRIIQAKAVHLRLPSAMGSASSSTVRSNEPVQRISFRIPYLMNEYGEVHGNRLASFFFLSDVAAIFLQGAGGGMQAGSNPTLGTDVLLFGLASQLFFFAVFTALAVYVYISPLYQELPTSSPIKDDSTLSVGEYNSAFFGLFSTITVLFVRNFYRVIEFTMGYRGYLATTESFMYVFDTLFIFFAFLLYAYFNFAAFLAKGDKQLQRDLSSNSGASMVDLAARKETERSESEKVGNNVIVVKMMDQPNYGQYKAQQMPWHASAEMV